MLFKINWLFVAAPAVSIVNVVSVASVVLWAKIKVDVWASPTAANCLP